MACQPTKPLSCYSVSGQRHSLSFSSTSPLSRPRRFSASLAPICRPVATPLGRDAIPLGPVLPLRICYPPTSASAFRGKKNNCHNGNSNIGGGGGIGGGGSGGGDGGEGGRSDANRNGALVVLARAGRKLESLPADLAAAVDAGHVTGLTMLLFLEMEGSPLLCWLLFPCLLHLERILADDLFLPKLAVACGVCVAVIAKVGTGAINGLFIAMKAVVKELDGKVEKIPAASTPHKVEEKWWSCFGAEVSAGLVLTESSMRGGPYQPAAMTNVSASFSRGSSGVSGKNGKA